MYKKNLKIANLQFLLSIMIVLIHSITIFINLPGKELQYIYGPNISTFIQIFIGDGIARIAVPMFFIFSGYLYFRNFHGTINEYVYKNKKRIFSLIIPYLFWSSFTFFSFYLAQKIPYFAPFFSTRNGNELNLEVILKEIILDSYNSPLWYCRYLIIFSLFSIILYYIIKKIPIIVLIVTFWDWFVGFSINTSWRADAVFFYCLGAFIGIHFESIKKITGDQNKKQNWIITVVSMVTWTILLLIRSIYYCYQNPSMMLNGTYDSLISFSGKFGIIAGLIAVWKIYDYFVIYDSNEWSVSEYSFLIFVCHHPVVNIVKKIMMKVLGVTEMTSLITYFVSSGITICLIIMIGRLIKSKMKPLWKLITGGRS